MHFYSPCDSVKCLEETVAKALHAQQIWLSMCKQSYSLQGVETRVPFLEKEFLDFAMGFDPNVKMCSGDKIEKYVLRKAFEVYIPAEIVWRQKEQFSDGVGYGWIDYLKKHAESAVTDDMMKNIKIRFPAQLPSSKGEYCYREIFDGYFTRPSAALTVLVGLTIACSTPTAFRRGKEFAKTADPSGRSVTDVRKHFAEKSDQK